MATDPDERALLYVMQWMHERGMNDALSALEVSSGLLYDESKLQDASRLMQLIWKEIEDELGQDEESIAAAEKRAEAERLLRAGINDYPTTLQAAISESHPANIICVRFLPGADQLLSGSGDSHVRLMSYDGHVMWATRIGSGAVLSLDLHPLFSHGKPLVLAGAMDGSTHVLHVPTGRLLASSKPHAKYVMRAVWSHDGCLVASGSQDNTLVVQRVDVSQPGGQEVMDGGVEGSGCLLECSLQELKQVPLSTAVTDLTFLTCGRKLLVAARDTNYLRCFDTGDGDRVEECPSINVNEASDDHVSFSVRALAPSPCGSYLLAATDTPRCLLLRTSDWSHLRCLFGPPIDKFFNPVAAWHRDSNYVYMAGPGAEVLIYHVGSGRIVSKLPGHKINVRGMDYDKQRNMLVTCSFDKTLRLYRYES